MKKIIPFVVMSLLLTLCGGDDLPESTTVISDQECLSASEIKEIELSISESEISLGEDITQPENGETIEELNQRLEIFKVILLN